MANFNKNDIICYDKGKCKHAMFFLFGHVKQSK